MLKRLRQGDVGAAFSNLLWLALERLTQVGVAIVTSGVLARYLGADVFGKWQYANTLLTVVSPITWVCGAEILVPAMVAAGAASSPDRPRLGRIMGSAFALRMGIAVIAVLLIWTGMAVGQRRGYFDAMVCSMFAGLAVTMLFREPFGVLSSWLQARTYSKPALLLSLSTALLKAAAVYLLVRVAAEPGVFGWVWAVESAAIGIGLLLYYRAYYLADKPLDNGLADRPNLPQTDPRSVGIGWHIDRALLKHFASAGAVFWVGLICMYLFMKLDRLMLEHYIGFAELGRYAAAQQLNENWITLALMLAQTVAPAFVYRVSDKAQLRRNLWRLLMLTGVTMAVGAIAISFCSPFIVRLVFGPGFDTAASFLQWAAWLSVLAGLEAICNLFVLKYQAKYIVLLKWLAALAAAFLANLLLIPAFGAHGALMGIAVGYGVTLIIDALFIRRMLSNRKQ